MNIITLAFASAFLFFLTTNLTWAKDDQGVNDYAKAYWNPEESCVPFVRKYESVCGKSFPGDPDQPSYYDLRADPNACSKLPPDESPTVQSGQIISIYLNQVFVNDFTERGESFFGKKRGEIAVVARVAELDEKNDFDFTNAGVDRGRLVYYSEGVQPGQILNLSQLPIYGPIEYKGKPLVMEFYILELDVKANTEVSGLLSAAAGLGAIAYPPASPILKVLDTIGSGLLKANKSDLEFKYHAALLGGEQQLHSLKAGTLEYGNYAFVRMPYGDGKAADMSNTHRWNRWFLNQKDGRIYSDCNCSEPLLSQTYLSLQINRAKESTTLDPANNFANFMTKLTAEANASTQEKTRLIEALKESVTAEKSYTDAKKLIAHANQVRWPKGTAVSSCLDVPTFEALNELIGNIRSSLDQENKKPPFDEIRANTLVAALGRLIGGQTRISPLAFDKDDVLKKLQAPECQSTAPSSNGPAK